MKFIIIFGPSAVGKMTVGQELAKITDLKLFHNHISLELAYRFFDFGHSSFKYLSNLIREEVFNEVAKSELYGLIFTFVWAFDYPEEDAYVAKIVKKFTDQGGVPYYVELTANQDVRATRNHDPHRLQHKPSKQNLEISERVFWHHEEKYRLNSHPGEYDWENYLRIDTGTHSPAEAAALIKERFGFANREEEG